MPSGNSSILAGLRSWLSQRRFPTLLIVAALLLGIDAVIPDPVPFADEILLTVVTAALASWRKRPRGS